MNKINETYANIGLLVVRLGVAGFMLTHGWPKLSRLFGDEEITFGDPIGVGPVASLILAVLAEFLCSILIAIGFKTRLACIPLIITMLVAAFIAHADDPFGNKEKALLYVLVYLILMIFGGGKYSADYLINRK